MSSTVTGQTYLPMDLEAQRQAELRHVQQQIGNTNLAAAQLAHEKMLLEQEKQRRTRDHQIHEDRLRKQEAGLTGYGQEEQGRRFPNYPHDTQYGSRYGVQSDSTMSGEAGPLSPKRSATPTHTAADVPPLVPQQAKQEMTKGCYNNSPRKEPRTAPTPVGDLRTYNDRRLPPLRKPNDSSPPRQHPTGGSPPKRSESPRVSPTRTRGLTPPPLQPQSHATPTRQASAGPPLHSFSPQDGMSPVAMRTTVRPPPGSAQSGPMTTMMANSQPGFIDEVSQVIRPTTPPGYTAPGPMGFPGFGWSPSGPGPTAPHSSLTPSGPTGTGGSSPLSSRGRMFPGSGGWAGSDPPSDDPLRSPPHYTPATGDHPLHWSASYNRSPSGLVGPGSPPGAFLGADPHYHPRQPPPPDASTIAERIAARSATPTAFGSPRREASSPLYRGSSSGLSTLSPPTGFGGTYRSVSSPNVSSPTSLKPPSIIEKAHLALLESELSPSNRTIIPPPHTPHSTPGYLRAIQNLKEFAKDLGVDDLSFNENHTCMVNCVGTDSHTVMITYDSATNRLYLYSTLLHGIPTKKEDKLKLYENLLEGALLGRELAGGNVGVSLKNNYILLCTSIPMDISTASSLRNVVPLFLDSLVRWRKQVEELLGLPPTQTENKNNDSSVPNHSTTSVSTTGSKRSHSPVVASVAGAKGLAPQQATAVSAPSPPPMRNPQAMTSPGRARAASPFKGSWAPPPGVGGYGSPPHGIPGVPMMGVPLPMMGPPGLMMGAAPMAGGGSMPQAHQHVGVGAQVVSPGRERPSEDWDVGADSQYAGVGLEITDGVTIGGNFNRYTDGVVVVKSKGAASRAGILPNDIITKVNNARVTSLSDFQSVARGLQPGAVAQFCVERQGQVHNIEVVLDATSRKPGKRYKNAVKMCFADENPQ